ncbi:hypothetical protein HD599_000228 [Conyzicola lurida]|uniref:Uncharacterized protein n=1 Tax=Conyzicola lurida TaxID=1172621 RepID=A0A841AKA9_9MICO|nr:DUF6350 family protein [Conyzicola lurida]MBB5841905.1 hypothetical protein [Conyzicola lurida]
MNRSLTALFAAFEAALVVAIGIGISLAPLTILWAAQFGFQIDWIVFWRASVDIWLMGHGVDSIFTLDPTTAVTLGLAGADAAFRVTLAAIGFSLLTVALGVRAGRRVAETKYLLLGELVAVGTFGLLSTAVTFSALHPLARPSVVQGALFPTAIFAVAVVIGSLRSRRPSADAAISPIRDRITGLLLRLPRELRVTLATSLRGGVAAATAVIGVSAVLLAVLLAINYATVVRLYEGLHSEVLGGFALTLAQIAFVPTFVIWVASWLVGPGFAIGVGSSVSPLTTALGPTPAIPILGALPAGDPAFGFVGLLVPVVAGFLAGALLRPGFSRALSGIPSMRWVVAAGVGIGAAGGLTLGLLAAAASGAAGPGRLADVGPDALSVGLWAALEIGLAAIVGLLASPQRIALPRRTGASESSGTAGPSVPSTPSSPATPQPAAPSQPAPSQSAPSVPVSAQPAPEAADRPAASDRPASAAPFDPNATEQITPISRPMPPR